MYSERGHFIIDKYSGGDTEFNVFALKPYNNFLKAMDLHDKRGNMYNSMMDSMAGFHIFSIYNVPFQSVSVHFDIFDIFNSDFIDRFDYNLQDQAIK